MRLVLDTETLLLPDDRFILRSFSPMLTIAGGTVMELHFGAARLRRKGAVERLEKWKTMDLPARIQFLVEQRPLGIEFAELRQSLGCLEEEMPKDHEKIGSWFAAGTNLKRIVENSWPACDCITRSILLSLGFRARRCGRVYLPGHP